MKGNKGITLVALVITIIILLILAGVAISMIGGENGLFAQANGAATKYNQAAINEAEWMNMLLNEDYTFGGNNPVTPEIPKSDGSYNSTAKVNTPDTSKLPTGTTYYVTWNKIGPTYESDFTTVPTAHWYDYNNGQWANIKTISTDNSLEAYWVWVPRFAYKLPENGRTAKEIEVAFVKNDSKTVVQADGTEVQGYYSTDSEITTGGTGLYTAATDLAKGTNGQEQAWIIHPAFCWDNNSNGIMEEGEQLNGIWFAKFEASSETPTAANGGGNVTNLKVQVKPGVESWRYIQAANSFAVCRAMQDAGGVVGTETGTKTIDTHMAKNMEWAAVSVLSQSKYGVFNPRSATGYTTNGGDGTLKVWNNPCNTYITGMVAATAGADAKDLAVRACVGYNTTTGIKGSTTGTVYGVYDMAGGAWDQVMGIMESASGNNTPSNSSTGFSTWPDRKYYDIYSYGTTYTDEAAFNRGKIGDLTRELSPVSDKSWNDGCARFVYPSNPLFHRGGYYVHGAVAGAFAFFYNDGGAWPFDGFRPVLVVTQ